jgi:hypothetical protein
VKHNFLVKLRDDGSEHLWHGYPDECFALTSFADSLVAHVLGRGWWIQPPITVVRKAFVIDFASEREAQAEASIQHGWNGTWEFPMGVVNTVYSRAEVNEQNARIERHMTLIATAMTCEDFHKAVGEKLLDVHSCPDKIHCDICKGRIPRGLADTFELLSAGTKESEVHLFSQWAPSEELSTILHADGVRIVHHDLSDIPLADLKANRAYHIWDGTENQGHEFREAVWAPAWRKQLVYGEALGGLLFLRRVDAEDLAQFNELRRTAKTWGEFRRLVSPRILARVSDEDTAAIPDSDPFADHDPTSDYWPFPNSEQLEFLPEDVIELGEVTDTGEGDRLDLSLANETEIVRRLRCHGYDVARDDALVGMAANY